MSTKVLHGVPRRRAAPPPDPPRALTHNLSPWLGLRGPRRLQFRCLCFVLSLPPTCISTLWMVLLRSIATGLTCAVPPSGSLLHRVRDGGGWPSRNRGGACPWRRLHKTPMVNFIPSGSLLSLLKFVAFVQQQYHAMIHGHQVIFCVLLVLCFGPNCYNQMTLC